MASRAIVSRILKKRGCSRIKKNKIGQGRMYTKKKRMAEAALSISRAANKAMEKIGKQHAERPMLLLNDRMQCWYQLAAQLKGELDARRVIAADALQPRRGRPRSFALTRPVVGPLFNARWGKEQGSHETVGRIAAVVGRLCKWLCPRRHIKNVASIDAYIQILIRQRAAEAIQAMDMDMDRTSKSTVHHK